MSKKLLPPIHLLCSDDELRPALCYVEVLDGIATATNGYLIGRMNLSEYGSLDDVYIKKLSGRYIHRDAWKLIHEADEILISDESQDRLLVIKGGIEAEIKTKDSQEIKFPPYSVIIDKVANSKFDKRSFIAFNHEWIVIAKKLFGKDVLIIRFFENEGMFLLFPGTEAKAFMGIMPVDIQLQDAVLDFSLS